MLRKIRNLFLLSMLTTLSSWSLSAQALDLSEGTMSLDGKLGVSMSGAGNDLVNIKALGDAQWYGNLNFGLGYAVIDGLFLDINVKGTWGFTAASKSRNSVGVGFGLDYYFDTSSIIYPYLGASGGVNWKPNNDDNGTSALFGDVTPKVGFLVSLNESVALDVGAAVPFNIQKKGTEYVTTMGFNVGWVGIKAFF